GEAHLVSDEIAELGAELLRDARRDRARRDAPGLGMTDEAMLAAPDVETDLRQLCGLARAGGAGDDHHGIRTDRIADLAGVTRHRQLLGIRDRRPAQCALRAALDRTGEALP